MLISDKLVLTRANKVTKLVLDMRLSPLLSTVTVLLQTTSPGQSCSSRAPPPPAPAPPRQLPLVVTSVQSSADTGDMSSDTAAQSNRYQASSSFHHPFIAHTR